MLRACRRFQHGLLAAAAIFVLMGAKGEGCGGGGGGGDPGDPPEPPPPLECDPGFHVETVCDDSCNGECHDECVPDALCPDGTYEQWVCAGDEVVCMGDGCPPPPEPSCWVECVPIDSCGPGWHEQWVCDPMQADPSLPPEEQCYLTCVPDDTCGPGEHEEWICDDVGPCSHDKCVEGPALSEQCDLGIATICQVDPYCCEVAWDAICVSEVASVLGQTCGDPSDYPPPPEQICGPVCVPNGGEDCPPGQHLEEICDGGGDGMEPAQCQLICVDDVPSP
jgi:hypothetical protein